VLVFHAEGDGILRFGGRRAHAPRYDLQQLIGSEPARRLLEEHVWREAELGAARDNPGFVPAPALAALARPGAQVDLQRYAFRRSLAVSDAREGVVHRRLAVDELARARPDLADLRIVDGDGRQWPYLLEREGSRLTVPLEVDEPRRVPTGTRHALRLPDAPLAVRSLELAVDASYVDRPYRLLGRVPNGDREVELARGQLTLRPGLHERLTIALAGSQVAELALEIDDGGDAPLPLTGVTASVAGADLYLAAQPGQYWLLVGDADATAPSYELGAARALVHALPSHEAEAGALEANPSYRPSPGPLRRVILLWAAVAVVVIVLGATTLRLAARGGKVQAA
jgi:hypothetical protein